MTGILLPICGFLLAASGVRAYLKARSTAALLYAVSFGCGWVALTVWPVQNGMWIDNAVRWPGIARLIADISSTLCVALQFAFASTLVGAWSAKRRLAVAGYGILLLLRGCFINHKGEAEAAIGVVEAEGAVRV